MELSFRFIEEVVYSMKYDDVLKTVVRQCKAPEDALDFEGLKKVFEKVEAAFKSEDDARKAREETQAAATAAAASSDGTVAATAGPELRAAVASFIGTIAVKPAQEVLDTLDNAELAATRKDDQSQAEGMISDTSHLA